MWWCMIFLPVYIYIYMFHHVEDGAKSLKRRSYLSTLSSTALKAKGRQFDNFVVTVAP